jgi:predicted alpha/beta superfamily hydrolase
VLDENRQILVTLPESYERTTVGYPVLYMLDGSSHILHATATTRFLASARNRIPEMIVVAVPNTNRNRDLTPGPGATRFQQFLEQELIPWVDSTYRTVTERVIMGHSLGGSFVTHTLLNRPQLFDVYIAVSAPLWRYDSLSRDTRAGLPRAAKAQRVLYLTVGEHENPRLRGGVADFVTVLKSSDSSSVPRWSFADLPDEDHNSTPHRSLYAALETHYAPYRFPFFEQAAELDSVGGLEAIQAHYARFGARFGYAARPPEGPILAVGRIYLAEGKHAEARHLAVAFKDAYPVIAEQIVNLTGYDLMRRGEVQQAAEVFKQNVALFPNSPNVYDSLADAYCRLGDVSSAGESMRRAVGVAERKSHPRLNRYRERAEKPCS